MTISPNQALWEKGDFTEIASFMRPSGEALVRSLNLRPPLKVLDLGCGDGTTAVPIAQLGAEVTGIDIARNLVEAGNRRAAALNLASRLRFQEGDACALNGVPDRSFDLTLSVYGAMFAPKPFDVAKEMVRVTRPGGKVVMGNWIPGDPTWVSQLLKISAAFTPPPPEGFISPMLWGVESNIIDRFEKAGVPCDKITMVKDTWTFKTPRPPSHFVDAFRRYYGPTMNAYDAADKAGKTDDLHRQIMDLTSSQNTARDGSTSINAAFMRVTVSL